MSAPSNDAPEDYQGVGRPPPQQQRSDSEVRCPSDSAEHLRNNMYALLHGLKNYLHWKAWGPARSEAILSDIPPSPHLKDLLGE